MIRVWLQAISTLPAARDTYTFLSQAERACVGSLRSPQQRASYVAIHGWMRQRVADVLGVPPDRVPLHLDRRGAPVLYGCVNRLGLSHHEDRVALAVSDSEPVGIDILMVPTDASFVGDTGFVLSPAEIHLVRSAVPERRGALFASCWTRKEAYAKLLRTGLTCGLDRLTLTPCTPLTAGAQLWTDRRGGSVVSVATDVAVRLDVDVVS